MWYTIEEVGIVDISLQNSPDKEEYLQKLLNIISLLLHFSLSGKNMTYECDSTVKDVGVAVCVCVCVCVCM